MSRNLPSGYEGTTVLPKATVSKMVDGQPIELEIVAVHLDSNENMFNEPLHEVHATDKWGQFKFWFETTDSLKTLFDNAVSTFIPQDDVEANVSVALGNG